VKEERVMLVYVRDVLELQLVDLPGLANASGLEEFEVKKEHGPLDWLAVLRFSWRSSTKTAVG
jgi:hypothetical protein